MHLKQLNACVDRDPAGSRVICSNKLENVAGDRTMKSWMGRPSASNGRAEPGCPRRTIEINVLAAVGLGFYFGIMRKWISAVATLLLAVAWFLGAAVNSAV